MLPSGQSGDMPVVVVAGVFRDPGIDIAYLFAIQKNVRTAACLRTAANDGNPGSLECEGRFGPRRRCFFESNATGLK